MRVSGLHFARVLSAVVCVLPILLPAQEPLKPISNPGPSSIPAARPKVGEILNIPRLEHPPTLEDFSALEPASALARSMGHAGGFLQKVPTDGATATQQTDVYLGYDLTNLYVVFLCHDSQPNLIRSTLTKRENANTDDSVQIYLDTYQDQRRSYIFSSNPEGIQSDALYSEDSGSDTSWDTVWNTSAKKTDNGYMVIMGIPFRSLRFSHDRSEERRVGKECRSRWS